MSETNTAPDAEAPERNPTDVTDPPTAADPPVEKTAEETAAEAEAERQSRVDRRLGRLNARFAEADRERMRLAAENAELRRAINPEPERPPTPEDIPRLVEERVAVEMARRGAVERAERFHEAGKALHPDWADRCQNLMQMGADAGFAELLVEMPDGAKVAAALADDPDEMERIAALKSERSRAIALGKFAAAMEHAPPTPARRVSQAPPPIRGLNGTFARAEVDESRMTSQQLVEHYSRQAMAARTRH
jgi:hypothetical protein